MKYFLFLSIINIIKFLLIILPLLICVAFLTLIERKVLAAMQRRTGPNVLGFYGFLQPFADGLKLIVKETILPDKSNKVLFIVAPISMFFLSLIGWAVIPFGYGHVFYNINSGVLYLLAVSSLGIYGVIIAGWSSNSKYAFLGALRAAAQLISYEISIGFIVLTILLNTGSLNLSVIVLSQKYVWYCFSLWPSLIMFFISILAETNRPPFDLPEAEAELVSGYNVEYSALSFAFFFLAEYAHIVLMSTLTVLFFFGGWLPFPFLSWLPVSFVFSLKVSFFLFVFVWVRAVLPRYRYDQLMFLGWKRLLPLSFGYLLFVSGFIISFNLY